MKAIVVRWNENIIKYDIDIFGIYIPAGVTGLLAKIIPYNVGGFEITSNGNLTYWDGRSMQLIRPGNLQRLFILMPEGSFDIFSNLDKLDEIEIGDYVNWILLASEIETRIIGKRC